MSMSIEEKILKYLHEIFPDTRDFEDYDIPLKDLGLDPQDEIEYDKTFGYLVEKNYIEHDGIYISITNQGVFYYEEKYLKYYYLEVIKIFLEFLERLEKREYANYSIPSTEILDKLEEKGIYMNIKEFYRVLRTLRQSTLLQETRFFKNIRLLENEIKPFRKNGALLTRKGEEFLHNWRFASNLFAKITDPLQKEILLKEYREINKDIEQGSWKGAYIKIGSILEYFLRIWLQDNGVSPSDIRSDRNKWKDITFYEKIEYYMNNSYTYANEIGTLTHWDLVQKILRVNRNYVHLSKYEERVRKGGPIKKEEFEIIYLIFQEILRKF